MRRRYATWNGKIVFLKGCPTIVAIGTLSEACACVFVGVLLHSEVVYVRYVV